MGRSTHKVPGGLIRISLDANNVIKNIKITGDFFIHPEESIEMLEKDLVGVEMEEGELLKRINSFFMDNIIESPGIKPEDFVTAIKKAIG